MVIDRHWSILVSLCHVSHGCRHACLVTRRHPSLVNTTAPHTREDRRRIMKSIPRELCDNAKYHYPSCFSPCLDCFEFVFMCVFQTFSNGFSGTPPRSTGGVAAAGGHGVCHTPLYTAGTSRARRRGALYAEWSAVHTYPSLASVVALCCRHRVV